MSSIEVRLVGDGTCDIRHQDSGARIKTSVSPEYGGRGGEFSSTDLLAAALGSCIASNLEPVAIRYGIPLDVIRVTLDKRLGTAPKRIESLAVIIEINASLQASVRTRLERAARQCAVHRSLSREVAVTVELASG